MRTLASAWDTFHAAVLPPGAGPIQRQEMRRAFYAGAQAALLATVDISEPEVSEDAGVAALEALHDECRQFAKAISEGRA